MNYFSKLSLVVLTSALSGFAQAGTMGDMQAEPGYSFFIGATGGIGMYDGTYRALNAVVNDEHFSQNGGDSFIGGGLVGVDTKWNNWYIALVGNVLYNSLSETVRSSTNGVGVGNHVVGIQNDFQYGGDVRLGTNIWNATPYLLGGVEAGKWDMTLTNNSLVSNRGIPALSSTTFSDDLVGPKAGLGVMLAATDTLNVGIEYSHTWFGTINRTLVDSVTGVSWNHRTKVQQNQAMLSAVYKCNWF